MKRRLQAALLAAVILLSAVLCATPVLAAGTVTVSQVSGTKGELVDVTISLTSDDVCSGNFNICFDSDALELVEHASTDLFHCISNPYESGRVRVSFMRIQPVTDALLCTLTFRVTAETSDEGSPITLTQVKLYDENGSLVSSLVIEGAVARKTVHLRMSVSETAEHQAVRAIVELGGSLSPAGGNFCVSYDPTHFTLTSVLPLDAMDQASYQYNIVKPGLVRISFSGTTALKHGQLCALVFKTVGGAGASTDLTLGEVKLYNENSAPLDVTVIDGKLSIVVPSEDDPKLWCIGGAMQADRTATVAVVLQGRGYACGGNVTLQYNPAMTAEIHTNVECESIVVNHDAATGQVQISWASPTSYSGEFELLTIDFSQAVEGIVELSDASLYYSEGTPIPVADVRPGKITNAEAVAAVVDTFTEETVGNTSRYTVTVDIADLNYFTGQAIEAVTAAMALYKDGRLSAITLEAASQFNNGTSEVQLTVETTDTVTGITIFLMGDIRNMSPLCRALIVE